MLTNWVSDRCYLLRCYHWPTMASARSPTMCCLDGQWKVTLWWTDALRRLEFPARNLCGHHHGDGAPHVIGENLRPCWLGNQDSNLG